MSGEVVGKSQKTPKESIDRECLLLYNNAGRHRT